MGEKVKALKRAGRELVLVLNSAVKHGRLDGERAEAAVEAWQKANHELRDCTEAAMAADRLVDALCDEFAALSHSPYQPQETTLPPEIERLLREYEAARKATLVK